MATRRQLEFPCSVNVEDVKAMCKYFGVDIVRGKEYYLLPLVAEACMTELPAPWEEK